MPLLVVALAACVEVVDLSGRDIAVSPVHGGCIRGQPRAPRGLRVPRGFASWARRGKPKIAVEPNGPPEQPNPVYLQRQPRTPKNESKSVACSKVACYLGFVFGICSPHSRRQRKSRSRYPFPCTGCPGSTAGSAFATAPFVARHAVARHVMSYTEHVGRSRCCSVVKAQRTYRRSHYRRSGYRTSISRVPYLEEQAFAYMKNYRCYQIDRIATCNRRDTPGDAHLTSTALQWLKNPGSNNQLSAGAF